MLATRLWTVLRRQWWVVAAGLLVTIGLALLTVRFDPPQKQVTATVLILPPGVTSDGSETNPFLQLGGLTSAADVLAKALNDPRVHDRIITTASSGDYIVERDLSTSAPVLLITADADRAEEATAIRAAVLEQAPRALAQLQSDVGVPTSSQLTVQTLVADGPPQTQVKTAARTIILVVGVGAVATLLLAGALDARAARRREDEETEGKADGVPDPPL